jgi:hypothetical protein
MVLYHKTLETLVGAGWEIYAFPISQAAGLSQDQDLAGPRRSRLPSRLYLQYIR